MLRLSSVPPPVRNRHRQVQVACQRCQLLHQPSQPTVELPLHVIAWFTSKELLGRPCYRVMLGVCFLCLLHCPSSSQSCYFLDFSRMCISLGGSRPLFYFFFLEAFRHRWCPERKNLHSNGHLAAWLCQDPAPSDDVCLQTFPGCWTTRALHHLDAGISVSGSC